MALNQFDGVIYINLNHRRDRNKILLEELKRLEVSEEKVHRLEAIHDFLNGHRGCAQSHMKALELAKEMEWENVLILEDDVVFTKSKKEIENIIADFFEIFEKEWDVFFLGANVFKYEVLLYEPFKKVLCAHCAHAYAVNSSYFETLHKCFYEAYLSMKGDDFLYGFSKKALDQHWKNLQIQDRWYIGKALSRQRRSYSDIIHEVIERYYEEI